METIPKVIHYCWFGGNPLPPLAIKCIESWKKYCPDYEIMEWNESNYDVSKNEYMHQAYQKKVWGFVPDYARLDIIYENGGIYFDTDVEVVKNIDALLDNKAFAGFEDKNYVAFGLGFGAIKGLNIFKELRDSYETLKFVNPDGLLNKVASPVYQTKFMKEKGLKCNNKLQIIQDIKFFPTIYFCPKDHMTGKLKVTKNTYTIHHYSASWFDENQCKNHEDRLKLINIFGKKIGVKIFNGINTYKKSGVKGLYIKIKNKVLR